MSQVHSLYGEIRTLIEDKIPIARNHDEDSLYKLIALMKLPYLTRSEVAKSIGSAGKSKSESESGRKAT